MDQSAGKKREGNYGRPHRPEYGWVGRPSLEDADTHIGDLHDGAIMIVLEEGDYGNVFQTWKITGMDESPSDDRFRVQPELTL